LRHCDRQLTSTGGSAARRLHPTDTDSDGDSIPLAQGTNRIGLLVESGGTLNGNITPEWPDHGRRE
jgi:hypothetical protein